MISGGFFFGLRNLVQGNLIGTDVTGGAALGNGGHGVDVGCYQNVVGGTAGGASNRIAFNGGDGVSVGCATGNQVRANSIFLNGDLGIDLGNDGVTANDPNDGDTGANNLQNFPVLSSATTNAGYTTVTGSLNSTPSITFDVDLFVSPSCDSSGHGEGETFLKTVQITTDPGGNGLFSETFVSVENQFVTATATDPNGNTSEFSACQAVREAQADLALTKTAPPGRAPTGRNLTYTLTVTNSGPDPALGVTVEDQLPSTVTYVSATPSQGACGQSSGTVYCDLGTVGNGGTATIRIVVKPTTPGTITNRAGVSSLTSDPNGTNNRDTESTSVCRITSRRSSIPCP